jgi:hypothetical protein
MTEELKQLLEIAKGNPLTPPDAERQRRSFAYGNTHFENERITRNTINEVAEKMNRSDGEKN